MAEGSEINIFNKCLHTKTVTAETKERAKNG